MSHTLQYLKPRRGQLIAVLLIAAAALALLLSMQGSAAQAETDEIDSGCISERFCVWTGTFYAGEEENWPCGGFYYEGKEFKSAKNRCSWNIRIGWYAGGTTNWKACMSPGGERPEPGRFNEALANGC
jgi:hypothetical protein